MKRLKSTFTAGVIGTLLLLAGSALAASPDPSSVSELWSDVGFRWRVSDKLTATFSQNVRFDESMSRHYLSAPELELRYELMDWWQLEAGYRYAYERDNDAVFQDRSRLFVDSRFIAKLRPAALDLRLMWQKESRREQDDGTATRHIMRTRMKAKLRRTPVASPYVSLEMAARLDGLDEDVPAGTVVGWRLDLGIEWTRGPVELDTRYHFVSPAHDPEDPTRHVLSVGLRLDLDH